MANRATADRAASPILSVIVSIVFHVGIVVAVLFTFAKKLDIPTDSIPLVPVDLVTIADQTNIAPTVKPDDNPPPPEPPMVQPTPQPDVAPPQIDIAPDAKPKEKPKPQDKFNIADIENLLKNRKAKAAPRSQQGAGLQTGMTADLAAVLKSLIYRCWSPPQGAPHPERLIVRYELFLSRDGTIAQAPQLTPESASAAASDPYMAAAAGAARRAIYACSPYRLPGDKYALWHDVIFTFDPRTLDE